MALACIPGSDHFVVRPPGPCLYDLRSLRNKANPDDTFEAQLFYGDMKAIVKTSHREAVPLESGDYGRVYDALYDTLVNGQPNYVKKLTFSPIWRSCSAALSSLHRPPLPLPGQVALLRLFIFLNRESIFTLYDRRRNGSTRLHRQHTGCNMIYLRKANERGHANHGWLDSAYFLSPTIMTRTLWASRPCG